MVTLEQVSRRIFSDSSWVVKSVVGTFLLIVPIVHFFAFGYLYRQVLAGRHGEVAPLADWDEWKKLFVDGLCCFAIVFVLAIVPIFIGWLVSLPFLPFIGPIAYMPMAPGLLLAAPLSAAGIYRFQRREDFRDAFQVPALLRMIARCWEHLMVPTFAYIGLLFVLSPLFPYALFTGGLLIFAFYAVSFHQSEAAARSTASAHSLIHR